MMQIATIAGKVVLVGSVLPSEWNGSKLDVHELTEKQAEEYRALRENRQETHFDGQTFSAVGVTEIDRLT